MFDAMFEVLNITYLQDVPVVTKMCHTARLYASTETGNYILRNVPIQPDLQRKFDRNLFI